MSEITRSEAIAILKGRIDNPLENSLSKEAFKLAIASLETDEAYQLEYESTTKSETLVSLEVYKQVAWERDIAIQQLHELGYEFGQKIEPTTKNDLGVDAVSREAVHELVSSQRLDTFNDEGRKWANIKIDVILRGLKELSPVTPQEPRCKDCKWWKDSDGEYRRGCGAESQCPINRKEVYEGDGYCFLYEPQESEG